MIKEFKKKKYLILLEYKRVMSITLIRIRERKENRILNFQEKIKHLI